MERDSFYKDSLILTISNLSTGVLGFIFSIILSKELGAEGMGVYGLIMPVYNLFICLICGGMLTAISKVASTYYSTHDYSNLRKSVNTSLYFDLFWSVFIAILVVLISRFISGSLIKDSRTLNSILAICPALVFVALSSIIKGYFYGISKVKIPAIIDIIEKFIRICILVSIISFFHFESINETVTSAYIALSLGELVSFLLLFYYYKKNKNKYISTKKNEGRAQLLFNVLAVSFPLCLNGFLSTLISSFSAIIVPRRLMSVGLLYSEALSQIGKFSGMALNIILFPMLIVYSFSIVLVPDLSKSLAIKDYYSVEKRIIEVIKISIALGIITAVICFSMPMQLGKLFYSRVDLGPYIKFASISAPLVFASSASLSILNGLNKQNILLRNSLLISFEELILLFILTGIPSINIYGYGISLFITSLSMLIINVIEIKKVCYFKMPNYFIFIELFLSLLIYYFLAILMRFISESNFALKYIFIIIIGYLIFLLFQFAFMNNKKINYFK